MPVAKLILPQNLRVTAFRGFVKFLRDDPTLNRVVKTWRDWSGQQSEDQLPENISQCPWIRLTPMTAAATRSAFSGFDRTVVSSPLNVQIATCVPGTNWDDSANLWGAIEARLFSQDPITRPANDAILSALGISDVLVTTPGHAVNDDHEAGMTIAVGTIQIDMQLAM